MSPMRRSRNHPRLGQHLLTARAVARAVAEAIHLHAGERVLEVGPGTGMLTHELLAMGASVVAVEKDPAFVATLTELFSEDIARGALTLIHADIRSVTIPRIIASPYKVAANIPYYITGELIRLFLTASRGPSAVSLLVQKEVAERIARSKKESLLSLSVKAYGTPRYVKTVRAGSFSPPPLVDSAILAIEKISRKRFAAVSEHAFFELLHAGFAHKRKTLAGNLKKHGLSPERVTRVFTLLNLPPAVRAEDMPLDQWFTLAHSLTAYKLEPWKTMRLP